MAIWSTDPQNFNNLLQQFSHKCIYLHAKFPLFFTICEQFPTQFSAQLTAAFQAT